MAMIDYTLDESVAVVTLNSGENRFNPDFLNAYLSVLDEIEHQTEARTLVVHSSHEKIFSNGIDLEWLVPIIQQGDTTAAKADERVRAMSERLLANGVIEDFRIEIAGS